MVMTGNKEQGVALISVLLVVAVVVTVATALLSAQDRQIRRTAAVVHGEQIVQYVRGIEDWAMVVLRRDLDRGGVDSLDEDWGLRLAPIAVEGGTVAGNLQDAQGRFNLNNLVVDGAFNALQHERFIRLLTTLEVEPYRAEGIADALRDWLDPDQEEASHGGAEDYYYLGLSPPYRSAGVAMASASELRLVRGMDEEIWRKLAPHVIALPGLRYVNVNTAGLEVLRSLSEVITERKAQDILDKRWDSPFSSTQVFADFLSNDPNENPEVLEISVGSGFFLLSIKVGVVNHQASVTSLIHRENGATGVWHRSFGVVL